MSQGRGKVSPPPLRSSQLDATKLESPQLDAQRSPFQISKNWQYLAQFYWLMLLLFTQIHTVHTKLSQHACLHVPHQERKRTHTSSPHTQTYYTRNIIFGPTIILLICSLQFLKLLNSNFKTVNSEKCLSKLDACNHFRRTQTITRGGSAVNLGVDENPVAFPKSCICMKKSTKYLYIFNCEPQLLLYTISLRLSQERANIKSQIRLRLSTVVGAFRRISSFLKIQECLGCRNTKFFKKRRKLLGNKKLSLHDQKYQ